MPLSENVKLQFIQKTFFYLKSVILLYLGLFKNFIKTVDIYDIHNIVMIFIIEIQSKMQSVWDARRKILAK